MASTAALDPRGAADVDGKWPENTARCQSRRDLACDGGFVTDRGGAIHSSEYFASLKGG